MKRQKANESYTYAYNGCELCRYDPYARKCEKFNYVTHSTDMQRRGTPNFRSTLPGTDQDKVGELA